MENFVYMKFSRMWPVSAYTLGFQPWPWTGHMAMLLCKILYSNIGLHNLSSAAVNYW